MNSQANRKQLLLLAVIMVSGVFYVGVDAVRNEDTSAPTTSVVTTSTTIAGASTTIAVVDLIGEDPSSAEPCTIPMKALRPGTSGKNVVCLQQALVKNKYLKKVTGTYFGLLAVFCCIHWRICSCATSELWLWTTFGF